MRKDKVKVLDVIEALKKYDGYKATIFGVEGIMLDIGEDYVRAELLDFEYKNHIDMEEATIQDFIDYIEWHKNCVLYSEMTTNMLVEVLEKHKDKRFYLHDEETVVIFESVYEDDKIISIEHVS